MDNNGSILLVGYEDDENLGLRSIAAYLKKNNVSVEIMPYAEDSRKDILEYIFANEPVIVGISLIFQRMINNFAEFIKYARKCGVTAHFTMGGHFPTIEHELTLKMIPELDSIVRHEGEITLLELYKNIFDKNKWKFIDGLVYREGEEIIVNPPRELIQELDTLPFVIRSLPFKTHREIAMCSMAASRGCYYDCSFCSIKQFYGSAPGQKRRTRSPNNVVDEMQCLFEKGIKIFNFRDDDFGMTDKQQRSWIKDFTFELKKRRLSDQIIWRVSCRVDEVDEDIISLLQEVGLSFLYLGIESGSPDGLRTFNKHYDVDQIYTTLNLLEKTGMSYDYGFMLLEPYATFKTIKEDLIFLDNLCKNGRTVLHFTKLLPYAGTPIADRLRTEKRLKGDIATPDYDYLDSRINLFEYFLTKAFFDMFFSTSGLTNRLQLAKFDAIVIKKFFSDNYDVRKYICDIDNLTNICNRSALDTMNLVADFMNESSYDQIRRHKNTLDMQALQQVNLQKDILRELDRLKPISIC